MADRSERLAIIVTASDLASGKLSKVRGELAGLNTSGKLAAVGLGSTMKAAQTSEKALGHLKGKITGLTGALGPLLGVGGLLGLTGLLTSSINEASEFGASVAKVTAATGLAAPVASAMVDTLDKWGVSGDSLITMLGKMEKNVGTLAAAGTKGKDTAEQQRKASESLTLAEVKLHEVESKRGAKASALLAAHQRVADAQRKLTSLQGQNNKGVSGAAAFQKQYGVSLLDSSGKIADANVLLQRSADYFNSNATATDKATFMAKLWGKAWQDLIPILSKGSAFIRAQEADAIHLTDTQVANIQKFRDAQRNFADAFGDIQVKVGAEIMPLFTTGLTEASAWFDSHGDEVVGFFRDAAKFAGDAAKSAGEVFSGIKSGWESIPAPLRDFLVKGLIADRTIKFLFGVSPANLVLNLAGNVIGPVISHGLGAILGPIFGNFAQRGSLGNPMIVKDIAGSLGGGGGPAGGGSGLLASVLRFVPAIAAATIAYELAANVLGPQSDANRAHEADLNKQTQDFSGGASLAEINTSLSGIDGNINRWNNDLTAEGVAFQLNIDGVRDAVLGQRAILQKQADYLARAQAEGWGAGRVTTSNLGADAQDSSEKAIMARRSTFTSNPTRNELRNKIGLDKQALEHATGANAKTIGADLTSLKNRLDNRIERANKEAIAKAKETKTAVDTGATKVASAVDSGWAAVTAGVWNAIQSLPQPQTSVTVPVTVTFAARNAASAIAVTSIRATAGTGPTSGSGV